MNSAELVKLASCHATQYSKNDSWHIEENITNELLEEFPNHISDKDMGKILDFARKFELIALNTGINIGKEKNIKIFNEKLKVLQNGLDIAIKENERLATALDKEQNKILN